MSQKNNALVALFTLLIPLSIIAVDIQKSSLSGDKNATSTPILDHNTTSTVKVENRIDIKPPANLADNKTASSADSKLTDTTHIGREHVFNHDPLLNNTQNSVNVSKANSNNDVKNSTPPFEVAEKNDNKKSVPKKGVALIPESAAKSSKSNVTTSVETRPKKPLFTELDEEDAKDPPISAATSTTTNLTDSPRISSTTTQKAVPLPKPDLPSLESIAEQKDKKSTNYVVPIVAVILSVPLVAIIISVLYKRLTEYWQHRHYRRMDFLIEGMYNG